ASGVAGFRSGVADEFAKRREVVVSDGEIERAVFSRHAGNRECQSEQRDMWLHWYPRVGLMVPHALDQATRSGAGVTPDYGSRTLQTEPMHAAASAPSNREGARPRYGSAYRRL